jgi:hypothetical protein
VEWEPITTSEGTLGGDSQLGWHRVAEDPDLCNRPVEVEDTRVITPKGETVEAIRTDTLARRLAHTVNE